MRKFLVALVRPWRTSSKNGAIATTGSFADLTRIPRNATLPG